MKIAIIIVRVLLGFLFIFGAIVYAAMFLKFAPPPELTGNTKIFMDGVDASKYLMPLIKITEFLCGIAFVSGYFVPLATVVIAPIIINIFLFHIFVDSSAFLVGLILVLMKRKNNSA